LEVCVATLEDALAAEAGGADRLEVNSALELGGLTPSPGSFQLIRDACPLSLTVMLRPRPGGFDYTPAEYRTLIREAEWFLENGADAVAFGLLKANGAVDGRRCLELVELAGPGKAVFHRAFDLVPNPLRALEELLDLGFARVMTSGQQPTVPGGIPLIRPLIDFAAGRIDVLPAGGITVANVAEVVEQTGCREVHASLRNDRIDASAKHRPHIRFGSASGDGEHRYRATDVSLVRAMRDLLDALLASPG